ncbi:RelA/SpoT domain-containing protein [Burkholderia ubonensis]|uniref:RelA/SpoT domain-containing protein n=1 Tax=Burkholderia ubonensis TaxID=101571 RepID=UPI0009B4D903|nr:RelA/SpoT domain-containing protein [Burkholderia ubonensis]
MAKNPTKKQLDALLVAYTDRSDQFDLFRQQVLAFFTSSRQFHGSPLPLVHSVKSRLKNQDHLREKLVRKYRESPITIDKLFTRITDFAGVRVLHLHSYQFSQIHWAIKKHIDDGYWTLAEPPVAYSWDPEATASLMSLGIRAEIKESYYTSIHYIVKPHAESDLTCEIQVRTLFEEAWGEIDHAINYPTPTTNVPCREQLRVLAKLASTGTRLADSIFKSLEP